MKLTREQLEQAWENTLKIAREVAAEAKIQFDYPQIDAGLLEQAWNGPDADTRETAQRAIDAAREAYVAGLREFSRIFSAKLEGSEVLPALNVAQKFTPNAPPRPPAPTKRLAEGEEGPDPLLLYRRDNNAWLEEWYYPHESRKVAWLLLKEAWEERHAAQEAEREQAKYGG